MRDVLLGLKQYDAWATDVWLDYLTGVVNEPNGSQLSAKAEKWVRHLLWAQVTWYERVCPEFLIETVEHQEFKDLNTRMNDLWVALIEARDLSSVLRYNRLNGEPQQKSLAQIVLHVCNHGTYHRGQLRSLCEELGITGWPDTDIIYFEKMDSILGIDN